MAAFEAAMAAIAAMGIVGFLAGRLIGEGLGNVAASHSAAILVGAGLPMFRKDDAEAGLAQRMRARTFRGCLNRAGDGRPSGEGFKTSPRVLATGDARPSGASGATHACA
jgi:hypothetical protein